jgi:hypothetical protein
MDRYRVMRLNRPDVVVEADYVSNASGFVRFERRPLDGSPGLQLVRQIKATQVKEVILIEDNDDLEEADFDDDELEEENPE